MDLDDYLDKCITCGLPSLLYKGNTFTCDKRVDLQKECKVWQEYRSLTKPLVVWIKRKKNDDREQTQ